MQQVVFSILEIKEREADGHFSFFHASLDSAPLALAPFGPVAFVL